MSFVTMVETDVTAAVKMIMSSDKRSSSLVTHSLRLLLPPRNGHHPIISRRYKRNRRAVQHVPPSWIMMSALLWRQDVQSESSDSSSLEEDESGSIV